MTQHPASAPQAVQPQAGTVLLTRSPGWTAWLIRLGAALRDRPNLDNHVAVVHHTDIHGTTWCIEGRPGGVGWRDAQHYLASRWTITNAAQPITPQARIGIAATMRALLGTAYDWDAIAADAAQTFGLHLPGWEPTFRGTVPGHVVCSSAAAYAYAKNDTPHPTGDRAVTPSDWETFIQTQQWETTT